MRPIIASLGLLALCLPAHAGLFPLQFESPGPDVVLVTVSTSYSAGAFSVTGNSIQYVRPDGTVDFPFPGLFTLNAVINSTPDGLGQFVSGDFELKEMPSNVTALKGTITGMFADDFPRLDATPTNPKSISLEFLADGSDLSGNLASDFRGVAGIKLNLGTVTEMFKGFAEAFSRTGGVADIGRPVPEPSSLVAFGCLALAGFGFRRRRRC